MRKIGFIGLGIMGYWMATHLLKKYKKILVFNRSKKNLVKLKKNNPSLKIIATNSLEHIGKESSFIFSCVGNDSDLEEIYFSRNGIINNINKSTYIVDHTTSTSDFAIYSSKKFSKKKSFFFDAPVSGGEIGAKKGQLSVMIGGYKKHLKVILPLIGNYSKKVTYMGEAGNGQLAKMVNQICVAGVIQGLSEGLIFAKKNKLNFNNLFSAISSGAAQSWQMDNRSDTMWNNKFNFGFMNKHMYKDLKILEKVATKKKIKLPITREIIKFYKTLIEDGFESDDTSSLIKLLK